MKERISPDLTEKALKEAGLKFFTFNGKQHFRIEYLVDFWPGTSKYLILNSNVSGYGLTNAIKLVKLKNERKKLEANPAIEESSYKIEQKTKPAFIDIADKDIDELENAELRRIIVYLSKKLMEAEDKIAKLAPF